MSKWDYQKNEYRWRGKDVLDLNPEHQCLDWREEEEPAGRLRREQLSRRSKTRNMWSLLSQALRRREWRTTSWLLIDQEKVGIENWVLDHMLCLSTHWLNFLILASCKYMETESLKMSCIIIFIPWRLKRFSCFCSKVPEENVNIQVYKLWLKVISLWPLHTLIYKGRRGILKIKLEISTVIVFY